MPHPDRLGLSLPLTGVDARTAVQIASSGTAHGYDGAWCSEVQGPDAFTTLGALAVTTDLDLGVAVVPAQTRTAAVLGMTAVSLAELSQGRFTLGIGASSELIVRDWAGQPFDRPLTAVRETVEALGPLLRGERSTYDGEIVRMRGYRPHATPGAGRVPLVVGALNPRSCRQVGELDVDGLALNQVAPRHVAALLDEVASGRGGVLDDDFRVVTRLFCSVTDDVETMRALVRRRFAPYIATRAYNRFYRWMGYEVEADAVLAAGQDRDAMAAALSDDLVDDLFVIGTADEVAERIAALRTAGVTEPVVQPLDRGRSAAEHTLWSVAEADLRGRAARR